MPMGERLERGHTTSRRLPCSDTPVGGTIITHGDGERLLLFDTGYPIPLFGLFVFWVLRFGCSLIPLGLMIPRHSLINPKNLLIRPQLSSLLHGVLLQVVVVLARGVLPDMDRSLGEVTVSFNITESWS